MKRAFKIYKWAWVCLLTITAITAMIAHPTHHNLAQNPNKVDKIVHVDLPDLTNIESEDNLDRGASRWNYFEHSADFEHPLTAKTIKKLDKLCKTDSEHWSKDKSEGCYIYSDAGGIDDLYSVSCYIYNDHVYIYYIIDETEGIFVIIPFFLIYTIFILWGVVLGIAALLR